MSDERELERDAETVRAAYRKLPRVEPPAALDRAVLAQARAAVAQRPAARRPRWLLPVGLAATAVLAIGVASRMGKEPEQRWPARPAAPAAQPAEQKPQYRDAPAAVPPAAPEEGDFERKSEEGRSGLEAKSDLGKLQDKDAETAPAPALEDERRAAPKVRAQASRPEAPSPPASAPAPAAAFAPAPKPEDAPVPEAFPGRDEGTTLKKETGERGRQRAAPAPPPVVRANEPPAAPAQPAPQTEVPAGRALAAPPADTSRAKQAELRAAPPADRLDAAQSKSAAAVRAQGGASGNVSVEPNEAHAAASRIDPAERERPDSWLVAIRRVLAEGDARTARRELQAFQRRNAGYPVPDDLARLLE